MSLVTYDLLGTHDKVEMAIERFKMFEPPEGYYLAFSGGKDSQTIYELAKMAGVKFDAHYSVTSVDPPELVRFIKTAYPEVHIDIPHDSNGKPITMWNLIPRKSMPPTRIVRYCCSILKETGGGGRLVATGVRKAESSNRAKTHGIVDVKTQSRKKIESLERDGFASNSRKALILNYDNADARRSVEMCYRTSKTMFNPIIDWSDEDVWEFLNNVAKVGHCELYDQGYKRIGCIGCPMANKHRHEEFERYPKYKALYLKAFDRMLDARRAKGDEPIQKNAQEVFDWWMQ